MPHTTLPVTPAGKASVSVQTQSRRFFAPVPLAAWIAAVLVAVLHIAPQLQAVAQAPAGWTTTGNLTVSPDFMQYRVWMRQALEEGPVVSNRFTTEPNRPYLPVPFYYGIGRLAQATGISPEWAFAWIGSALAFLLTLLLFATVRYFVPRGRAVWLAFGGVIAGGGLGGYIMLLRQSGWAASIAPVRMLFIDPFGDSSELIDAIRGDYVFSTIFDTHFLLVWLLVITALLAFYRAIRSFSWPWVLATSALFVVATIAHVYEGITLLVIAASITLLCWVKDNQRREALITTAACALGVAGVFLWIAARVHGSGLPTPAWRGVSVHPTILLLGFPLAWALLAWGVARYWRTAGIDQVFLLGWILGCTALSLSAPFYPWPNRGVLSLQVPLTIVATAVWFGSGRTVNARGLLICVLLMGSSPAVKLAERWRAAEFDAGAPYKFLSESDRATITELQARARRRDVLLAGARDRLWLVPEYAGRLYAGHFFLTVDYDRKQAEVDAFYRATASQQAEFLKQHHIRFLFVNQRQNPTRFNAIAGLRPLYAGRRGTLFEFQSGEQPAS